MGRYDDAREQGTRRRITSYALLSIMVYIAVYTFESPIRYVLASVGASQLILLRDLLVFLPVAALIGWDLAHQRIHPVVLAAAVLLPLAFVVSYINFSNAAPAALGFKLFVNVMLGVLIGAVLINPSPRVFWIFVAFWATTIVGVVLEKFAVTYPWVGMHATIGNLDVEISRDWQVTDTFQKRVGGFTRLSISAAGLMPLLCCIAMSKFRSEIIRHFMMLMTIAAVFFTTQKGALLAMVVVWLTMLFPHPWRRGAQGVVAMLAVLVDVLAPIFTRVLHIPAGSGGSYSSASIVERIMTTWPETFAWIERKQLFPFGTGLGGVGEAQRFVSTIAFHYPDNMFLFLLATFGVLALPLVAVLFVAAYRGTQFYSPQASAALSVLTFIVLYGIFVSIVEDQMEALFLGAALGTLFAREPVVRPLPRRAAPGSHTRPLTDAATLT